MTVTILPGDVLETLKDVASGSVRCGVTSPPYYGLRSYLKDSDPLKQFEIGSEKTPEEYIEKLVNVFRLVRNALSDDGTFWLNIGDSYVNNPGNGRGGETVDGGKPHRSGINKTGGKLPAKNLMMIPARVALALQDDGWYLRSEIIWHKPNPMPESVKDRPTRSHEMIYLFSKSQKYYYDAVAVAEPSTGRERFGNYGYKAQNHKDRNEKGRQDLSITETRNRRDVWTVTTKPYSGAHFAVFPPALIEPCILAGTSAKGQCPECGSPWVRQTSTTKTFESGSGRSGNKIAGKQDLSGSETNSTPDIRMGPVISTTTLGWAPSCKCDAGDPIPDIVLDPFGGSGTVGQVASRHGRDAILCELNNDSIPLIHERLRKTQLLINFTEGEVDSAANSV